MSRTRPRAGKEAPASSSDWALSPLPAAAEVRAQAASRLAARLRAHLADSSTVLEVPVRKVLYMSGQDRCDFLYLIESGLVKAHNFSANGKTCLLNIYGTNDLIGDSCLVQQARRETATALTPAVLRTFPRGKLLELISNQRLAEELLCYMASRALEQQETITLFVTLSSEQRLGWLLLALARKFGSHRDGTARIESVLTQEDLAQMIGTTRSRVGSFLKTFRERGLIRAAGNLLIIDHIALHAYLCSPARQLPDAAGG